MSAEESFAQYASEFPSFDSLPDGLLAGAPLHSSLPSPRAIKLAGERMAESVAHEMMVSDIRIEAE